MLLKRVYKILYILQKEKKKKRYSGGGVGPMGFLQRRRSARRQFLRFFSLGVCVLMEAAQGIGRCNWQCIMPHHSSGPMISDPVSHFLHTGGSSRLQKVDRRDACGKESFSEWKLDVGLRFMTHQGATHNYFQRCTCTWHDYNNVNFVS